MFYEVGWTEQYSCFYHGLVQIQGFQACFVVGFLMTALPKFLEAPGARPYELFLNFGLVLSSLIGLMIGNWTVAELGFVALILHTVLFATRRLRRRKDLPPDEFVFIPFGLLCALTGGLMLLGQATVETGRRLVEQGMMLFMIMAVGGFLVPRLLGLPRMPGAETRRTRMTLYLIAGGILLLSFAVESAASGPAGRLLRAAVVSLYFFGALRVHRLPRRKMWHVRLLYLSLYLVLSGLWLSGLFPDYEVVALHVTFVGGFSLMTLCIGARVVVSHCGFESLWERNIAAVVILGVCFLAALGLRVGADLYPDAYFLLLALAAGFWVAGAAVWGGYFAPKMRGVDTSE
ncbi:MAG: hypothetical protein A3F84_09605 [Candidatus Handelsmanbacteria bacterium RIFCSPLOWO2_12_FULL_64_10]|uniref:NnrS family protein n=1 Tax=Handelsmanbacteria sp. (strain RIFCSPLOWO2_12_FULL_64_10) TaxID=1817868 RepID=A0A1F6C523_HANXR|nr:MAG: hypothetical protein A3F84_09605 [Candidatus Handelsmanbacteria bacterium RIFCSPLOWO2_12_FULL_64_10]